MPLNRKPLRVFISHASANLAAAGQIEACLHAAGLDPWLDQSDIRVVRYWEMNCRPQSRNPQPWCCYGPSLLPSHAGCPPRF
jgi:TIR domain